MRIHKSHERAVVIFAICSFYVDCMTRSATEIVKRFPRVRCTIGDGISNRFEMIGWSNQRTNEINWNFIRRFCATKLSSMTRCRSLRRLLNVCQAMPCHALLPHQAAPFHTIAPNDRLWINKKTVHILLICKSVFIRSIPSRSGEFFLSSFSSSRAWADVRNLRRTAYREI